MQYDCKSETGTCSAATLKYTMPCGTKITTKKGIFNNLNVQTPTRTGYLFSGWYTTGNKQVDLSVLTATNNTYLAHWNPKIFTITYDPNGWATS